MTKIYSRIEAGLARLRLGALDGALLAASLAIFK
jgi:hypothetical protein